MPGREARAVVRSSPAALDRENAVIGATSTRSRFGSPLVLSRVHWIRPAMVVEVSYAEMTPDGLLRMSSNLGEREDKAAQDVLRSRRA